MVGTATPCYELILNLSFFIFNFSPRLTALPTYRPPLTDYQFARWRPLGSGVCGGYRQEEMGGNQKNGKRQDDGGSGLNGVNGVKVRGGVEWLRGFTGALPRWCERLNVRRRVGVATLGQREHQHGAGV